MSWNLTLTDIDPLDLGPNGVENSARKAYADFKANYSDAAEVFPIMDEQFTAALEAVGVLLRGVVGAGNVNLTLSGHANPDYKPRQGWANDYVSVHISSVVRAEIGSAAG